MSKEQGSKLPATLNDECLLAIKKDIGSLSTAWEVVNLFDANPGLKMSHPGFYLLARKRIRRSQQWYKVRRSLMQVGTKAVTGMTLGCKALYTMIKAYATLNTLGFIFPVATPAKKIFRMVKLTPMESHRIAANQSKLTMHAKK